MKLSNSKAPIDLEGPCKQQPVSADTGAGICSVDPLVQVGTRDLSGFDVAVQNGLSDQRRHQTDEWLEARAEEFVCWEAVNRRSVHIFEQDFSRSQHLTGFDTYASIMTRQETLESFSQRRPTLIEPEMIALPEQDGELDLSWL